MQDKREWLKMRTSYYIINNKGLFVFFFFFFYSHLTPHSPTGMAGGKDYAGAHRAKASAYKRAAIPTPQAITTDPDKVLTQKEKQTTL